MILWLMVFGISTLGRGLKLLLLAMCHHGTVSLAPVKIVILITASLLVFKTVIASIYSNTH
jgi:hypothetical protein